MSAWQNILGVAAIGTERQELTLPPSGSLLGRALSGLDTSDREGALLGAVALASLHGQAGRGAAADNLPPPEPCAAEQLPRCNAAAGRHLALMLGGDFKEVLPEWLSSLRGAGLRVPEEHLPALFDRANKGRALRPLVVEVMGSRGRWLAAQNPAWSWASADLGPDAWETGGLEERLSLLRSLRAKDPRGARELLLSTWKSEYAKDRESFLKALHVGLCDEDEPFLNGLLELFGDRSGGVRLTAGGLLLRLPSSRLTRHVSERISSLLSYKEPPLGKPLIEVSLPDDLDEWKLKNRVSVLTWSAATDTHTLGEKARWLLEAVGWVPPAVWRRLWDKSPGEVLEAALNGEWGEALSRGFMEAAGRHGDAEWVEAILANERTRPALAGYMNKAAPILASNIPAARLEAIILKDLAGRKGELWRDVAVINLLLELRTEWKAGLSRAVVDGAKGSVKSDAERDGAWHLESALKQFALYVSHELADELSAGWPEDAHASWRKAIGEFQSVLNFRRDALRAIVEEEVVL
ncbi:MAG TPA: DUF5691 domain-containing protein [Pyrinomonadaceae bacterium]|jgi:hypothetical protein